MGHFNAWIRNVLNRTTSIHTYFVLFVRSFVLPENVGWFDSLDAWKWHTCLYHKPYSKRLRWNYKIALSRVQIEEDILRHFSIFMWFVIAMVEINEAEWNKWRESYQPWIAVDEQEEKMDNDRWWEAKHEMRWKPKIDEMKKVSNSHQFPHIHCRPLPSH